MESILDIVNLSSSDIVSQTEPLCSDLDIAQSTDRKIVIHKPNFTIVG
jgi:hypothetical protein